MIALVKNDNELSNEKSETAKNETGFGKKVLLV